METLSPSPQCLRTPVPERVGSGDWRHNWTLFRFRVESRTQINANLSADNFLFRPKAALLIRRSRVGSLIGLPLTLNPLADQGNVCSMSYQSERHKKR
jgi:hypothetical protein